MVADCHMHVKSGDPYRREFSAPQILKAMDEAGVDKACIFAIGLPSRESNDLMIQVYHQAPDRFIPIAHVVPTEGIVASLETTRALMTLGCRGVKVHIGELAEVDVNDLVPVVRRCTEAKIPLLIDIAGRLDVARFLAAEARECNVVIAHMGSSTDERFVDAIIALAYEHANLYVETSHSMVPWKIGDAISTIGRDKVLWGSNGPLNHPSIELQKMRALNLDAEVFQKVTCDNIRRLTGA